MFGMKGTELDSSVKELYRIPQLKRQRSHFDNRVAAIDKRICHRFSFVRLHFMNPFDPGNESDRIRILVLPRAWSFDQRFELSTIERNLN
jgi:hypothetical protein